MSHSIHSNQLSGILTERSDEADNSTSSSALRFLEEVDYEEESLRLRRRRLRRAAGGIAGFTAARASFVR